MFFLVIAVRGDVKKVIVFGGGGRWGDGVPVTTFGQKSTTFCFFCFHFMQKPSKRVKTQ